MLARWNRSARQPRTALRARRSTALALTVVDGEAVAHALRRSPSQGCPRRAERTMAESRRHVPAPAGREGPAMRTLLTACCAAILGGTPAWSEEDVPLTRVQGAAGGAGGDGQGRRRR